MDYPITSLPPSPVRHHADQQFMDQPVIIRTRSPELQPGRQWSKAALLLGCFLIFLFPVMVAAVVAGAALGALSTPVVDVPTLRVYIFLGRLAVYCMMGA